MFGLSSGHLIILGIVALLFGGKRLPELGAGMGQTFRAFKDALEGRDEKNPSELGRLSDQRSSKTQES
jgi:sec-independent protein translocase protein TatA